MYKRQKLGTPTSPPPKNLQDETPLPIATIRARRDISIRQQLQETLQREEELDLPTSFLDPDKEDLREKVSQSEYTRKDFRGYDCSEPLDIKTVAIDEEGKECTAKTEPLSQREVVFRLLHTGKGTDLKVLVCQVEYTAVPYYCGVFSHQTLIPTFMALGENKPLSAEECSKLHESLTYIDTKGLSLIHI